MNVNAEKTKNEIIIEETTCNITINKDGEYITIDLADNDLIGGLVKIKQRLSTLKDAEDFDYDSEMQALYSQTRRMLGDDVLMKVFHRENPSILVMYTFFSKFMKIVDSNIDKHFGTGINRSGRRANARG